MNLGINRTAGWTSAAGISQMVESIVTDSKRVTPCSAVVNGEYGYEEISIGVPVTSGKKGIDRIIELDLTRDERRDLDHSATELAKKARLVKEVIDKNKP
jgi:malate dehydrogenase